MTFVKPTFRAESRASNSWRTKKSSSGWYVHRTGGAAFQRVDGRYRTTSLPFHLAAILVPAVFICSYAVNKFRTAISIDSGSERARRRELQIHLAYRLLKSNRNIKKGEEINKNKTSRSSCLISTCFSVLVHALSLAASSSKSSKILENLSWPPSVTFFRSPPPLLRRRLHDALRGVSSQRLRRRRRIWVLAVESTRVKVASTG